VQVHQSKPFPRGLQAECSPRIKSFSQSNDAALIFEEVCVLAQVDQEIRQQFISFREIGRGQISGETIVYK